MIQLVIVGNDVQKQIFKLVILGILKLLALSWEMSLKKPFKN